MKEVVEKDLRYEQDGYGLSFFLQENPMHRKNSADITFKDFIYGAQMILPDDSEFEEYTFAKRNPSLFAPRQYARAGVIEIEMDEFDEPPKRLPEKKRSIGGEPMHNLDRLSTAANTPDLIAGGDSVETPSLGLYWAVSPSDGLYWRDSELLCMHESNELAITNEGIEGTSTATGTAQTPGSRRL